MVRVGFVRGVEHLQPGGGPIRQATTPYVPGPEHREAEEAAETAKQPRQVQGSRQFSSILRTFEQKGRCGHLRGGGRCPRQHPRAFGKGTPHTGGVGDRLRGQASEFCPSQVRKKPRLSGEATACEGVGRSIPMVTTEARPGGAGT